MPPQPAPAFEALYREWFRPLTRWLRAMGVAPGDVEDVAQDVLITAQRRLDSFDGESPGAWLYAIALRTASNHRRLSWVRRVIFVAPPESQASSTPESELADRQLLGMADEVLAGLSDKLRRVFVLFEIEGVDGEEIAALEGIPIATVWTRLHNARKRFAEEAARVRKKRGLS